MFYKQFKNRNAVLYNNEEEINIINKLENSQLTTDLDYLVDLNNNANIIMLILKILVKMVLD